MSDFYKQLETPLDRALCKSIAEANAETVKWLRENPTACSNCRRTPEETAAQGCGCWSCDPEGFAAYRAEVARWAVEIKEFSKRTGRNPHLVVDQVKYEITLAHGALKGEQR